MWSSARLVLMWLVAVALPLQGVSAATMLSCGNGSHATANLESPDHAAVVTASHWLELHRFHEAADAHAMADESHSDRVKLGHPSKSKRSVCASCCTAAVIRSEAVVFGSSGLTDFYRPLVTDTPAAFLTPGIERPPRIVFA